MSQTPIVDHRKGIAVASVGITVLSFDALLVRLAETQAFNITLFRGLFVFIALTALLAMRKQLSQFRVYRDHGRAALLVTLLYGINTALFVFSISATKAANTVVILSSSAFFAALFSWFLLREKIPLRTWVAIAVSLAGVVVVFAGSIGLESWVGDMIALLLALMMGLTLTLLRRLPDLPKIPVVAMSGLVTAAIGIGFTDLGDMTIVSYSWLAVMGLLQMPIASVMLMKATRYLPSPEVSLFLLIESVLGPVWVWLVLSETVPPLTIYGGAAILGAVFVHSWLALKHPLGSDVSPIEPPL
ncbi:DMT family transporter [Saccharospirillum salsuginis]|uniref:Membrane protein n=1 Tax=Saccharospirillum salsuginis TaxID=418750 RepID=A0A918K3M2_9GAMM|nr:DMT family transporter [Saccharospirillum salsuginis]GGX41756.1 membrane protein [Saccharospirillum salsuginis]